MTRYLLFANTDWFLYNFRLASAAALKLKGNEVILVSPPGPYADRLQEQGFRWVEFELDRKGTNLLTEIWTVLRLAKLYRQEKPDVVHHFTVKCVLYGTIAALLTGVSSIVNSLTGLGYIFTQKRIILRRLISFLYRLLLRRTWTIFENPDDEKFFLAKGWINASHSAVIRGAGVDVDEFQPTPEPEGTPLVILPARMLWDKGVGEFVKAARTLKEQNISARFVLVGDIDSGNPTGISLEELTEWRKKGFVEWWGWQENMLKVYAHANVICLPSYREGLPKTLLEAAACGRAIVTTDVPGCREVVMAGVNGLLVPPADSTALANAIQTLIEDPSLRGKMGQSGRKLVVEKFSSQLIAEQTLAFYSRVTKTHPKNILS
jgi:glycosyltransferase involved in cell wall biosynthesis